MQEAFTQLAEAHDEDPMLHIEAREIAAKRKAGGVVWFDFATPCAVDRAAKTTIWSWPPSFTLFC